MKKIVFIFLTLFIFIPISKGLAKFSIGEKVPNMNVGIISNQNVSYNGVPYVIKRSDGVFVYGLEHQLKVNTTSYYTEYDYNDERFNLTDDQLNKINTLAYYGYGYKNHTGVEWYGVTQFLIWKELDYRDVFFTDKPYGNRIVAYKNEMTELRELVKMHNTLPSFSNDIFDYTIGTTYEIEDLNGVISNYEIKESNIDVEIKDNSVYISPKKSGDYEITFVRKSPVDRNYILYEYSGNQPLIYPGRINDIEFKINIGVNSGSITINDIEGAVYGIYNEDELITNVTIDSNGVGYLEELPLGSYKVKQISPAIGYKLDEKVYEIEITKDNKAIVVDSSRETLKGSVIINKYYGEQLEDGAIFEIYDITNNLIGTYKTENGIINIKLEYGEYYGIQTSGVSGYNLVDKFDISIKEEKDYIIDLYSEKEEVLVVEVPNTKKYDYSKFISIILIIIGTIFIIRSKKTTQ